MDLKEKLAGLNRKQKTINYEGTTLIIKEMLSGDHEDYETSLYKIKGNQMEYDTKNAKSKMFIYCVHDEQGNKVYELNDLGLVRQLPSSLVDLVFDVATELNGITDETVKGAVKN